MPVTRKADLVEVFSSLQGEGTLVGARQIFLRFSGCNLDCNYCDTDFAPKEVCRVEEIPASGILSEWQNPVDLERLLAMIREWKLDYPRAHHSISLTGGEPLLHSEVLEEWLPHLKQELPLYLETNGILPDRLEPLVDDLDWISMDIKLHSQSGERTDWETHRRFLRIATRTQTFVKIVVGENTPDLELQLTGDLVSSVSPDCPLILQPVTVAGRVGVSDNKLLRMQAVIADTHKNVRVIPQTHVFMNLA